MSRASALSCSRLYAAQPFTYLGILIAEKKLPSKFDKNLPSNLKKNLPSKSRQKVPSKLVKILPSELRKKVLAVHTNASDSYAGGLGYYVIIRHSGGFDTLYAHCLAVAVRAGETVAKGQVIGYVGSTGRSTGDHLHWEVHLNGIRMDPLDYFE